MSLCGKLEDLGVADVVQFIHMGGRSGTLTVTNGSTRGSVSFQRGRMIAADAPGAKGVGDLLLGLRAIAPEALQQASSFQRSAVPIQPLGKILLDHGLVATNDLREAMVKRIHDVVRRLIMWRKGDFEFVPDEIQPMNDLEVFPGQVLPKLELDSQFVLLEALRLIDESGEQESQENDDSSIFESWSRGSKSAPETGGTPKARIQVVSADRELLQSLRKVLPQMRDRLIAVDIRDAGVAAPDEPPPIVLVDAPGSGRAERGELQALAVRRPKASIVAIADSGAKTDDAYLSGAVSVAPRSPEVIAACVKNVIRNRGDLWAPQVVADQVRAGYAKLRRVYTDLRSGLLSTTLALNLMSVLAESVERAILFVVRGDSLIAVGAFGDGADGAALAQATYGLRLPLSGSGALTKSIEQGESRVWMFDEADLPRKLHELLGRPCNGQCAIFPVLGAKRMIAAIYADNGYHAGPIEEMDVLELATAQLGVAFENELLRRQLSTSGALQS